MLKSSSSGESTVTVEGWPGHASWEGAIPVSTPTQFSSNGYSRKEMFAGHYQSVMFERNIEERSCSAWHRSPMDITIDKLSYQFRKFKLEHHISALQLAVNQFLRLNFSKMNESPEIFRLSRKIAHHRKIIKILSKEDRLPVLHGWAMKYKKWTQEESALAARSDDPQTPEIMAFKVESPDYDHFATTRIRITIDSE